MVIRCFTGNLRCCTIIRFGNTRGLSLLEFHYRTTKRIAIDRQFVNPDLSGGFDRFIFSDTLLHFFPDWIRTLFGIVPLSLLYLFVVFLNFLSISVIYQFNHPRYNQDFIIVLGAGLLNGTTVSPLLAKRINTAISFYESQFKAKKTAPRLLMSGGQGSDEQLPEAVAMKEYAIAQGVPEGEILVETNSTTTYENMKFSKEIMDSLKPNGYKAIFASNNYHIFRAGLYADQAQLKADGIGAPTAFYYLPNAF